MAPSQQARGPLVIRVAGQARVPHLRHLRMFGQRAGQRESGRALAVQAKGQRLHAPQGKPRLECARGRPLLDGPVPDLFQEWTPPGHGAAHQIGMAPHVLRGRLHNHRHSLELEGPEQVGRRHGVVDHQRDPPLGAQRGDPRHVGDPERRVGQGLDQNRPGVRAKIRRHRFGLRLHQGRLDGITGKVGGHHGVRPAVHRSLRHQVVSLFEQGGQGGVHGGVPAGEGPGGLGPLQ